MEARFFRPLIAFGRATASEISDFPTGRELTKDPKTLALDSLLECLVDDE